MMYYKTWLIVPIAFSVVGCASYSVTPIPSAQVANVADWGKGKVKGDNKGNKHEGYVIYEPELYFKVVTTPANDQTHTAVTTTVTPFYLPNYKKPYRVTTFNFLAKADFSFTFTDGWQLTSLSDKSDNSTVANTFAGELATVLKAAGAGIASGTRPEVAFYKPKYDPTDGTIISLQPINLLPQEDPAHPNQ